MAQDAPCDESQDVEWNMLAKYTVLRGCRQSAVSELRRVYHGDFRIAGESHVRIQKLEYASTQQRSTQSERLKARVLHTERPHRNRATEEHKQR